MTRKPIVVGYDGSPGARGALDFAVETARAAGMTLEVVCAWTPVHLPSLTRVGVEGPSDRERASADKALAEALDHATRGRAGVEVSGQAVEGTPATALLKAAESASMLVVGSRGLGGFIGLLLGSTSIQVCTHSTCPVVVVRPSDATRAPGPEAGRVVVGLDGSPQSAAALGFAMEQASWRGVGVTAVLSLDLPSFAPSSGVGRVPQDVLLADPETGSTVLGESLAGWQEKYPDVDIRRRIVREPAARALVDASAGAVLLVVGSRGQGGFPSLLLGSVSHTVLHHAHGPVAVVHR